MASSSADWARPTGMGGAAAGRRLPSRLPLLPLPRRAYALHSRPLRPTTCVAALPGGGVGAAAKAAVSAQAAAASLHGAIDPVVLAATTNASFKLFLICAVVGWLLKSGRIPNSTATVMSKVRRGGAACDGCGRQKHVWSSGLLRTARHAEGESDAAAAAPNPCCRSALSCSSQRCCLARWASSSAVLPSAGQRPPCRVCLQHAGQVARLLPICRCVPTSQVASTLAAMPDPTLLLGIAAMALLQIGIGAACGLLLAPLLGISPAQLQQQQQRLDSGSSGWRGRSSPEAASAIAASMAAASGAPLAARALRPKQPVPATGGSPG